MKTYIVCVSMKVNLIGDFMKEKINILGAGFSCVDMVKFGLKDSTYLGGTAANVLSILGMLEYDVDFLIADYNGASALWMMNALKKRNVNLKHFSITQKKAPQVIEYINYRDASHKFATICPNCKKKINGIVLPTEKQVDFLVKEKNKRYSLFFYDRISEGIKSIIRRNDETWNFYEPNSFRIYSTFLSSAKKANILKVSEERFPKSFEKNLLDDLQDSDVELVIITLGSKGLKYSLRNKENRLKNWTYLIVDRVNNLIDSTGAGDWLSAIFIYGFLNKYPFLCKDIEEEFVVNVLKKAQIVSKIVCAYEGAQGVFHDVKGIIDINKVLGVSLEPIIDDPYENQGVCNICNKLFIL